jgi:hypothetical protein
MLGGPLIRTMRVAPAAAAIVLQGCSEPTGLSPKPETWEERAARHEAEFNATPDIQLPELRKRLIALGVSQAAITETVEDNGVAVLALNPSPALFDRLDKPALAKLLLDSRYRFDFSDPGQVRAFAHFVGAETDRRETAKARREIIARGEADRVPVYRAGTSLAQYAARLERYCGYKRGQALTVIDGHWLQYRPTMVDLAVTDAPDAAAVAVGADKFDCMKRAVDALELRRRFIGNRGDKGAQPS